MITSQTTLIVQYGLSTPILRSALIPLTFPKFCKQKQDKYLNNRPKNFYICVLFSFQEKENIIFYVLDGFCNHNKKSRLIIRKITIFSAYINLQKIIEQIIFVAASKITNNREIFSSQIRELFRPTVSKHNIQKSSYFLDNREESLFPNWTDVLASHS